MFSGVGGATPGGGGGTGRAGGGGGRAGGGGGVAAPQVYVKTKPPPVTDSSLVNCTSMPKPEAVYRGEAGSRGPVSSASCASLVVPPS